MSVFEITDAYRSRFPELYTPPGILAILEFAVVAVPVLFVMRAYSVGDAPLEMADINAQRIGIEHPFAARVLTLVADSVSNDDRVAHGAEGKIRIQRNETEDK